jgi:hypothetical protein
MQPFLLLMYHVVDKKISVILKIIFRFVYPDLNELYKTNFMKIKTFYIAFILIIFVLSGYAQPYRSNNSDIATVNPSLSINYLIQNNTRSPLMVHTKSINSVWNKNAWSYVGNAKYSYNADGKSTHTILVDTTKSLDLTQVFYYYDAYKNSTGTIYMNWNTKTNKWDTLDTSYPVVSTRNLFKYNSSNYITQAINQVWQGVWVNRLKTDYILNTNGKYTTMTVYNWGGSDWIPYYKDTLCVWHGNILAGFLETVPSMNGGWQIDCRYSSTFSTGDNHIVVYERFTDTVWDSVYRFTITYDTNGGSIQITEEYSAGTWGKYARYSNLYDSLKNYYGYSVDTWYASSWQITEGQLYEHVYNTNKLMLSEIQKQYNSMTHVYDNVEKHVFSEFQIPPTVSIRTLNSTSKIKIYPNPAIDRINIENTGNTLSGGTINIYDINGRLVMNRLLDKNEISVQIDLNGFVQGIYLLEVKNGNEVSRSRILIK